MKALEETRYSVSEKREVILHTALNSSCQEFYVVYTCALAAENIFRAAHEYSSTSTILSLHVFTGKDPPQCLNVTFLPDLLSPNLILRRSLLISPPNCHPRRQQRPFEELLKHLVMG